MFTTARRTVSMLMTGDDYLRAVWPKVERSLGLAPGVGRFEPLQQRRLVRDHAEKFVVRGQGGRACGVVVISPDERPSACADAAHRARSSRQALGQRVGTAVLEPSLVGEHQGKTFSLMRYREPFSASGPLRRLQHWRVGPRVFDWLTASVQATMSPASADETVSEFEQPLRRLSKHRVVSEASRQRALASLTALGSSAWRPKLVWAHYDFWVGNLLRDPANRDYPFAVIDWGMARTRGHAFYDLLRAAPTLACSEQHARRALFAQCGLLDCRPEHAQGYLLAALGYLAANLGEWPVDRFAASVDRTLQTLDRLLSGSAPART
jgi:Phosphotransferase enzyme family